MNTETVSTAEYGIGSTNVRIRVYDGTTKTLKQEVNQHNITTSLALMSVAKLIYGIFDNYTPDRVSSSVPHYVAVGSGDSVPAVSNNALDAEVVPTDYAYNRVAITSRDISPDLGNSTVSVVFTTYIPTSVSYQTSGVDVEIKEVGLFTQLTGDNCWARAKLTTAVTKNPGDVLDITWTINIKSIIPV